MSSDWWASKLRSDQPTQRAQQPTYPASSSRPLINTNAQRMAHDEQPARPTYTDGKIPVMDAIKQWKGTKAAQAIDSCPSCGGPHVFAIREGGINGASPAPRCYECGWNGGKFIQGDQSSWI